MSAQHTGPVKLYTTSWCGYCQAALSLLNERAVPHENIDLTDDMEALAAKKDETNWPTVPIIFIGDTLIGGYSELVTIDEQTKLEHLKA